jgi:predicted ABC-type ATPase
VAKDILIIAGPNGAGKTTFARTFLPREGGCLTFINADLPKGCLPLLRSWGLFVRES